MSEKSLNFFYFEGQVSKKFNKCNLIPAQFNNFRGGFW